MKRPDVHRVLCVVSFMALVALPAAFLPSVGAVTAAAPAPQVTVFLKNYLDEYNTATTELLDTQFGDPGSPAYGMVTYVVTTTLTPASLNGSTALIIDMSADMSLSSAEGGLIRSFAARGGRVGLFTYPRFYWASVGPNPDAFSTIADLFGGATAGNPDAGELASGVSSANVTSAACVMGICFDQPYAVTGTVVTSNDLSPFTPIASTGTSPVLTSPALGGAAVAVANGSGLLVTNAIGDLVQGTDANLAYREFVTDAIVWLARTGLSLQNQRYLPFVLRQ